MLFLQMLGATVALQGGLAASPPPIIVAQLADGVAEEETDEEEAEEEVDGDLVVPDEELTPEGEVAPDDDVPAERDEPVTDEPVVEEPVAEEPVAESLGDELRLRQDLQPWHIAFGILAWGSTNLATILGFLHFNDRWGFSGDPSDTGCARGDPILGTDFCPSSATGEFQASLPHRAVGVAAAVFFAVAITLGSIMPDPLGAADGDNEHATLLQVHRALRWVVLAGMIAQLIVGPIIGAVRDEPFETGRALAVTHLVLGTTTWAAMTAQGVVGSMLAW